MKYGNIFLNDVLMLGFDFVNGLLGVLLCFREYFIVVMVDI